MSRPHRQFQHTVVLPWRTLLMIGGLLLAVLAAGTLFLELPAGRRIWVQGALGVGMGLALAGGVAAVVQRVRASRGVHPEPDGHRPLLYGGLILALLGAFFLSLVPFPLLYGDWINTLLTLLLVGLAAYLGWRLLRTAAPLGYRQAQRAYQSGDDQTALALLEGLKAERPDFYALYHLEAMIRREHHAYAAAREAAERLVALDPTLYYGPTELGLILLAEGRSAEARVPLQRAVELAPQLAEAHFNLGMACVEAHDHECAIASLGRSLHLGLRDEVTQVIARYQLFRALDAQGYHDQAQVELAHLRRRAGVVARWRRELGEDHRSPENRREDGALIAAIERVIRAPRTPVK